MQKQEIPVKLFNQNYEGDWIDFGLNLLLNLNLKLTHSLSLFMFIQLQSLVDKKNIFLYFTTLNPIGRIQILKFVFLAFFEAKITKLLS